MSAVFHFVWFVYICVRILASSFTGFNVVCLSVVVLSEFRSYVLMLYLYICVQFKMCSVKPSKS